MARWRSRLTATVAVAAIGMIVAPQTALAVDCVGDPPRVESPSYTVAAHFDQGTPNPRPGDPFADQPTTTIYEVYGYAGLQYDNYDLGCGPDVARSPDAIIGTYVANFFVFTAQLWSGISSGLHRWVANPTQQFAPMDKQIEQATETFRDPYVMWTGAALLILGIIVMWRTRSQDYAGTMKHVGWALMFIVTGALLLNAPLKLAQAGDGVISSGVDWVRAEATSGVTSGTAQADPGVGIAATKHRNILYQSWLDGTFGNGQTECAQRFGPRIFDATAMTWDEERKAAADPVFAKELRAEKGAEYKAAAAEVKDFNESCYAHMIGQEPWPRVTASAVGALSAIIVSTFDILSAVMIEIGYLSFRLLALFGLFLLVIAIVRPSFFLGIVVAVFRTALNALLFGIAVGVFAVMQMMLIQSSVPQWLSVGLIGLSALIFWRATRAIRRIDPTGGYVGEYAEKGRRWGRWGFDQAAAYYRTRKAVEDAHVGGDDDDRQETHPETTAPPLVYATTPTMGDTSPDDHREIAPTPTHAAPAGLPAGAGGETLPAPAVTAEKEEEGPRETQRGFIVREDQPVMPERLGAEYTIREDQSLEGYYVAGALTTGRNDDEGIVDAEVIDDDDAETGKAYLADEERENA